MKRILIASARWNCSNGCWSLTSAGQRLATIEPSWDDRSWFVFDIDGDGEPVFAGTRRRIAGLKAMLLLWARKAHLQQKEAPL